MCELPAPAYSDRVDAIPFNYASPQAPLLVAEARIGPRHDRAAVVVDTGASPPFAVFLSTAMAQRLSLAQSADITPTESSAIGPRRQSYRTARLDGFRLGPVRLRGVDVAVMPMLDELGHNLGRPVDAIVGYHFLKDRRIAIDYAARRIDLAAPAPDARRAIGFVLGAGKPLVLVQATINGSGPFILEIDTGATGTSLSPAAAAKARLATLGQGVMTGAGGQVSVNITAASVSFGGIDRDLGHVAVSGAIAALGEAAGTPIDGILGTDFFQGTVLTIDYPARRLWLKARR